MKKIVSLIILLALSLTALVACGGDSDPVAKDYTLSIGVSMENAEGSSKVALTVAAVVCDADGKIVNAKLDCVEYNAWAGGALNATVPATKVALGEDYDKNNYMAAGDWYKQVAKFESYVAGKTQAEVAGITVGEDNKTDLIAGCTIKVDEMKAAVDNAFKNAYKVSFKSEAEAINLGLSYSGKVTITEDISKAKFSATFAAAVVEDEKVVSAILDTAEPEILGVSAEGAESVSYKGSKLELGEDYDKNNYMAAGDWYKQAGVFASYITGKTETEISGIELKTDGKTDLIAGCTIAVKDYVDVVIAAMKAAK